MSTFMAFAVGVVVGYSLGAVGMCLLIKQTKEDIIIERQIIYERENSEKPNAPELETESELEEPKEIIYGEF